MYDERSYNALMLAHWLVDGRENLESDKQFLPIKLMGGNTYIDTKGNDFNLAAPLPLFFSMWVWTPQKRFRIVLEGSLAVKNQVFFVADYVSLLGNLLPSILCFENCDKNC